MNPVKEGKKGLSRSAQMMLNLSMGIIRESSQTAPDLLESQLKDVISSVSFIDAEGKGHERSVLMKSKFENTLQLMKRNDVGLTRNSMIHVFKNSLDSEASEVLDKSLSEDNKLLIENAINSSADKTQPRKDFGSGGLSM